VLALLVLAPVARLPGRTLGLTVLLLLLNTAQVLLIIIPRQTAVPVAAALHPVNALLIFWVALVLARQALQFLPRPFALASA
jgi:hypothetical protein